MTSTKYSLAGKLIGLDGFGLMRKSNQVFLSRRLLLPSCQSNMLPCMIRKKLRSHRPNMAHRPPSRLSNLPNPQNRPLSRHDRLERRRLLRHT